MTGQPMGVANPVNTGSAQVLSQKTLDNTNAITVKDSNLVVQNGASPTKQAHFDLSGITAGQNRDILLPDYDFTPAARVKRGLAKTGGGVQSWAVPGTGFVVSNGLALAANFICYTPFYVEWPITITDWAFEVTAAPASNANRRVGIYAANGDLQPTGAPIYDSGAIAVASGFTGVKTASGLSIAPSISLQPGLYLSTINEDVAMSCRAYSMPIGAVGQSLGANYVYILAASQSLQAFTNPATAWTSATTSTVGFSHFTLFKWTE